MFILMVENLAVNWTAYFSFIFSEYVLGRKRHEQVVIMCLRQSLIKFKEWADLEDVYFDLLIDYNGIVKLSSAILCLYVR